MSNVSAEHGEVTGCCGRAAVKGPGTEGTVVSELLVGHTVGTQTRDRETASGA